MNVVCGRGFFNTHNLELILNCSTLARRRGWDKSEQLSQFQCFSFDFSRTPPPSPGVRHCNLGKSLVINLVKTEEDTRLGFIF